MAAIIKTHNDRVLRESNYQDGHEHRKLCNCRKPEQCPLNRECLMAGVVYKATVTTASSGQWMYHYGSTEGPFKQRYANHLTSFRQEKYRSANELSKHLQEMKEKCTEFKVSWSICQKAPPYSSVLKRCQLCLSEKLQIITADRRARLNKRSELVLTCRYRKNFFYRTLRLIDSDIPLHLITQHNPHLPPTTHHVLSRLV